MSSVINKRPKSKKSDKPQDHASQPIENKEIILKQGQIVSPAKQKIHWLACLFIIAVHIGALAGFFTFSWQALWLCLGLHWLTGGVGITLTYHRLLTHRSFKVPKPLEYFLTLIASLACQGGPITWVATHRLHHAKSEQQGDPHTPRDGFFWAHMGWCVHRNPLIDRAKVRRHLAPDLARDNVHVFLEKYFMIWTLLLAGALYAWGGWPFVVWGIFVRLVFVYHCTWLVNSATHVWGYRTYRTGEDSKNLWWVALLSYGEGWHNNHHAFQSSARHGLRWWEWDTTYLLIRLLEKIGLASAIKLPPKKLLAA